MAGAELGGWLEGGGGGSSPWNLAWVVCPHPVLAWVSRSPVGLRGCAGLHRKRDVSRTVRVWSPSGLRAGHRPGWHRCGGTAGEQDVAQLCVARAAGCYRLPRPELPLPWGREMAAPAFAGGSAGRGDSSCVVLSGKGQWEGALGQV